MSPLYLIAFALYGTAAACPATISYTVTVASNSQADVKLFSEQCEVATLAAQVHVDTAGGTESLVDVYNYPQRAQKSSSTIVAHSVTTANFPPNCMDKASALVGTLASDIQDSFTRLSNGNIVGALKRGCSFNSTPVEYQTMLVLLNAQGVSLDQNPIADRSGSSDQPKRVAVTSMQGDQIALAAINSSNFLTVQAFVAPGPNGWSGDGIVGRDSGVTEFKARTVNADGRIVLATVGTGEVVVSYCHSDTRYFRKAFPSEEELFSWSDKSCRYDDMTMKAVPGSSRLWIISERSGEQVKDMKPAGFASSTLTTVTLYDVASKKMVSNSTLGNSYAQRDCLAIATAPNGKTLFAFEEGGPDSMAYVIADADGNFLVENRQVVSWEPDACQAVAYDDNSFGIFITDDESEHTWALHVDDTGFQRSSLIQSDDKYAHGRSRTFVVFPDGDKQTMIQRTYTNPPYTYSRDGNAPYNFDQHNVVALNEYRGYLYAKMKKDSSGPRVATVFNYSPKLQKVSLTVASVAPTSWAPFSSNRLYSVNLDSPEAASAMQAWVFPLFGMLGCFSCFLWVAMLGLLAAGWRPWNRNAAATTTFSGNAPAGGENCSLLVEA